MNPITLCRALLRFTRTRTYLHSDWQTYYDGWWPPVDWFPLLTCLPVLLILGLVVELHRDEFTVVSFQLLTGLTFCPLTLWLFDNLTPVVSGDDADPTDTLGFDLLQLVVRPHSAVICWAYYPTVTILCYCYYRCGGSVAYWCYWLTRYTDPIYPIITAIWPPSPDGGRHCYLLGRHSRPCCCPAGERWTYCPTIPIYWTTLFRPQTYCDHRGWDRDWFPVSVFPGPHWTPIRWRTIAILLFGDWPSSGRTTRLQALLFNSLCWFLLMTRCI